MLSELITKIKLTHTSLTLHSYLVFCVVLRMLTIYSLSKFQACNTVLLTTINIIALERIYPITEFLYSLSRISPTP